MKKTLHYTLIFTFILNITISLFASIDAYFEIEDEPYSSELVRKKLFEMLR